MSGSAIRTICYRAFCNTCMAVVSPHPRMTKKEAMRDLKDHNAEQHPRRKS